MEKIPLIVVEEHHELFLVTARMIAAGVVSRTGNTLIHIDEHHDLACPVVNAEDFKFESGIEANTTCTYEQLRVSDFIVPLAFQGVFTEMLWLGRSHLQSAPFYLSLSTEPYGDMLIFHSRMSRAEGHFRVTRTSTSEVHPPTGPAVLSIDLDYFSCDNHSAEHCLIEVTPEVFSAFREDKRHPLRLKFGSRLTGSVINGRTCLSYREYDGPLVSRRTSNDEVIHCVEDLKEFLIRSRVSPSLIVLCRSRLTGYTPPDQWKFIEDQVLSMVGDLYKTEVEQIDR